MNEYEHAKFDFFLCRYQRADSFVAELFRLFGKADNSNQRRLGLGFPVHYKVYQDWYNAPSEEVFFAEFLNKKEAAQNDV